MNTDVRVFFPYYVYLCLGLYLLITVLSGLFLSFPKKVHLRNAMIIGIVIN